jgi:hypothetical protein
MTPEIINQNHSQINKNYTQVNTDNEKFNKTNHHHGNTGKVAGEKSLRPNAGKSAAGKVKADVYVIVAKKRVSYASICAISTAEIAYVKFYGVAAVLFGFASIHALNSGILLKTAS